METPEPPEAKDEAGNLQRLERELYARDTPSEFAERSADVAQLGIRRERLAETPPAEPVAFVSIEDVQKKRRRKIALIVATAVVFGILLAGGVGATLWYRLRQNVTSEQITLAVSAPAQVQAGDEMTYELVFGNTSHVDWENVEVAFEFPPGFTISTTEPEAPVSGKYVRRTVGVLASGASESLKVSGRLVGAENASVVGRAEIQLTPENFPSGRFTHTTLASTTIIAAPLDVAVVAAKGAAVGERVAATVTVTNKSDEPLEGAYVQLNPAVGMRLATEDPEFSPGYAATDRLWDLPTLSSLGTASRTVILFLEGQPSEQRALDVVVGLKRGDERFVQQRGSAVLTISSSALAVEQRYQNSSGPLVARAGDRIQGLIKYTNVGTGGLKNVVVKAAIVGNSFDPAALKLRSGAYDPVTRTITWTRATVPELALLAPQQSGEIPYEFAIKPAAQLPAEPTSKNSTITITSFVDSPDVVVPVGQERKPVQNQFVISVASEITLAADAFYDDGRLGITSTGPTPPKVGQQTTYSVRLRLGSTLNDIGEAQVRAVLPDGVQYTGEKVVTTGTVEYEERTGELIWTVAQVAGLTGRASPTADLYFQVAITPGENQVRETIPFLNRLTATGLDLFVDEKLTFEVTTYPTTESAVPGKGRVE